MKEPKIEFIDVQKMKLNGDIIVTDPCYFIPSDFWSKTLDDGIFKGSGIVTYNGFQMLVSGTAYGDGTYEVRSEFENIHDSHTPVDAGLIACIHLKDVRKINPEFNWRDKMYPLLKNVKGTVSIDNYNWSGAFSINTSDDEEYDDERYCDCPNCDGRH